MASTRGRSVVIPLTNKSGGSVAAGDVVVVDTGNNTAFTTSTAGTVTGGVGIAQETIANNATGRVLIAGYAALVNVSASVTRGNYGKTHTVVKQAVDAGSSRVAGTFCQFLTGGTTPDARVFSPDLGAAAGNVAVDAIFDAKGDLPVGTGADTAAKLTVGGNGALLDADSTQTTGLRWVKCIRGRVNADGTEATDTHGAFTSAKNSTGDYTVTFGAAFSAVPMVFVQCDGPAASRHAFIFDITTGDIDIITTNFAGSNTDADFNFMAVGF